MTVEHRPCESEWDYAMPDNWPRVRNKQLLAESLAVSQDGAEELLSVSHITGITPRSEKKVTMIEAVTLDGYRLVEPGDLVVNMMWAWMGALGVSRYAGIVSPAYSVYRPRPGAAIDTRYYDYLYRSDGYVAEMTRHSRGIHSSRLRIYPTVFLNLQVPHPPLEVQRAIADFLDRETAHIDTLIEQQQRLAELAQERRSAVISHAISRGLDGSAEVKPSGLGAAPLVPEHWHVMPLRHALDYREGPGILAMDFRDEGVPLLRVSGVRSSKASLAGCNYLDPDAVTQKWAHFRVEMGDLLISASASMGTVSEVSSPDVVGAVPYTGLIRIRPGRMTADFIRWFMVSGEFMDQVESMKTGSTIQHFGPSHLAQMRVALPPADEQRLIAIFLDEETAKIDTLIAETERFVELARERRSALITAAVTGQIDVRGEVL